MEIELDQQDTFQYLLEHNIALESMIIALWQICAQILSTQTKESKDECEAKLMEMAQGYRQRVFEKSPLWGASVDKEIFNEIFTEIPGITKSKPDNESHEE